MSFKRLREQVLDRFGIGHSNRCTCSWSWDGKSIALVSHEAIAFYSKGTRPVITRRSATEIMHDAAHWLVCDPLRRSLPDFGLGNGNGSMSKAKLVVPHSQAEDEESIASLLGIAYEAALGLPFRVTYGEHSWHESEEDHAGAFFDELESRGLMNDPLLVKTKAYDRVMRYAKQAHAQFDRVWHGLALERSPT